MAKKKTEVVEEAVIEAPPEPVTCAHCTNTAPNFCQACSAPLCDEHYGYRSGLYRCIGIPNEGTCELHVEAESGSEEGEGEPEAAAADGDTDTDEGTDEDETAVTGDGSGEALPEFNPDATNESPAPEQSPSEAESGESEGAQAGDDDGESPSATAPPEEP